MLDEPHNVRLHTRRAILGSYNLKDPPRSLNLRYPGPRWVPDSLRAAWCAAETLARCLPPGMPVTYEATHRMLELVLPEQREHCEIGIELMLKDGCFAPEQVPLDARSSITSKSPRQASRSASSLQDMIDEIIRSHIALMDKIARENREFRSQFGQTTLQDPAPTPRCSSSASGIAPRNENPSLVLSVAEAKVPKPETRSPSDRVTTTRPYARGFVELEHPLTTPCEQVEGVSQAVSLGMPTVF